VITVIAEHSIMNKIPILKTPIKEEQILTNAKGNRKAAGRDSKTYERLLEAEEELEDIRAYDALHDRAHSEIAAGHTMGR
jgi:hypothetical protein